MFRSIVLGALLSATVAQANPPTVIVRGPHHGPRRPGPGPVVVTPAPAPRPAPVYRGPAPVYRGPRVVVAPRVVARPWVVHPHVVIVRHYPMAITPIYIPIVQPVIVYGQPYTQTLEQGELWPVNTDVLYFTHYSFSMDRTFYPNGLNATYVTLYPQTVCQDPNGCGYFPQQAPIRLRVSGSFTDMCGITTTTAVSDDPTTMIQAMQLVDRSRYFCTNYAPNTIYNELSSNLTYIGGTGIEFLSGNRTY